MHNALTRLQEILLVPDRRFAVAAATALALAAGLVTGAAVAILSPLYALACLVALVAGLLMLHDSQWGFIALIATICLLPFGALPFKLGFTPTLLDVALLVIYFVWLARIATGKAGQFLVGTPLGQPIALFMLLACASFIAGLGHASLNQYVVRHFAEALLGIGLFFAVLNLVRTQRALRVLMTALIVAGSACAFIGIVLYFLPDALSIRLLSSLGRFGYPTGAAVLRYVEDDPSLPLRAISTSTDPNVLGGLLILVATLTVAQLLALRPVLRRSALAAMALLDIICLYLTYSRGSMLGLVVGLGVLSLVKHRKLIPVLAAASLLLLLLPQTQAYVQRFAQGLQQQDLATQMRLGEYKDAFTLIGRHPWIGVGFVSAPEASLYIGVSSVYLLIAEEMGLIGLSAFLVILVLFFRQVARAWTHVRQNAELETILLGLAASVAGILVGGILDHYFFNLDFPHSVSVFWLYLGLSMTAVRLGTEATTPRASTLPHSS